MATKKAEGAGAGKGTTKKEATKAATKAAKPEAKAPAPEPKKEKKALAPKEPDWVSQKNEKGEDELVDKNKFPYEVVCEDCGSIRYVSKSGLNQVTRCKPCARKARRKAGAKARRSKLNRYKEIVMDGMKEKLFTKAFKQKWGLDKLEVQG